MGDDGSGKEGGTVKRRSKGRLYILSMLFGFAWLETEPASRELDSPRVRVVQKEHREIISGIS
jgi:hypothetical protein